MSRNTTRTVQKLATTQSARAGIHGGQEAQLLLPRATDDAIEEAGETGRFRGDETLLELLPGTLPLQLQLQW